MNKPSILFVGKSLANISGLSYVVASLIKRFFKEEYRLGFLNIDGTAVDPKNIQVQGEEFKEISQHLSLYNAPLMDSTKCHSFDTHIENFKPNIVVSVHDPWVIDQLVFSTYKDTFFWVHYATIETPIYPETVMFASPVHGNLRKNIFFSLSTAHLVVPVTYMGLEALKKFKLPNLAEKPVYLGTDLNKKYTLTQTKREVFKANVDDDDFIFMCVGVNNERKMHGRTLEAFRLFLDKVPKDKRSKYKFYLHTDTSKQYNSTDLIQLVVNLGLQNNVVFSKEKTTYTEKELMKRFSACDCYVSLTGGEGFGYGFLEALLHEKPVIYSNYGGHVEICKNHGISIPITDHVCAINAHFNLGLADRTKAAEAMKAIAYDASLREKLSKSAYETVSNNFDWDKQAKVFEELILSKFELWKEDSYYQFHHQFKPKRIV